MVRAGCKRPCRHQKQLHEKTHIGLDEVACINLMRVESVTNEGAVLANASCKGDRHSCLSYVRSALRKAAPVVSPPCSLRRLDSRLYHLEASLRVSYSRCWRTAKPALRSNRRPAEIVCPGSTTCGTENTSASLRQTRACLCIEKMSFTINVARPAYDNRHLEL